MLRYVYKFLTPPPPPPQRNFGCDLGEGWEGEPVPPDEIRHGRGCEPNNIILIIKKNLIKRARSFHTHNEKMKAALHFGLYCVTNDLVFPERRTLRKPRRR